MGDFDLGGMGNDAGAGFDLPSDAGFGTDSGAGFDESPGAGDSPFGDIPSIDDALASMGGDFGLDMPSFGDDAPAMPSPGDFGRDSASAPQEPAGFGDDFSDMSYNFV